MTDLENYQPHHQPDYYHYDLSTAADGEEEGSTALLLLSSKSEYKNALRGGDDEFLLRCALTHDWDHCILFCQLLQELFRQPKHRSARSHQQRLQKQVAAAKRQLQAQDQWGNTALHGACFNNPPVQVITAMLVAASLAPPEPLQLHAITSRDHSTPLLIACATGASLQVIQALSLNLPSGLVHGGRAVTIPDQMGGTPLSELAVHYELQRKSPMSTTTIRHSNLPLDEISTIADGSGGGQLLDVLQQKMECLLQAAWKENIKTPYISVLHGAALVAASCPPVLTRFWIRMYPQRVSSYTADTATTTTGGLLPLHLCLLDDNHQQQHTQHQHALSVYRHAYFVEQLVQAYPNAARHYMPPQKNGHGRLPFVQAIALGMTWHVPSLAADGSVTTKGPLQSLWLAHPHNGMGQPDPATGLVPVALAAAVFYEQQQQTPSSSNKKEEAYQVDTLYALIQLYPQVLYSCIQNEDEEVR